MNPDDLEERIAKARAHGADGGSGGGGPKLDAEGNRALGVGLRIGAEFVSALVAGGGIGWALGRRLGSAPGGLLVGLLIGFAAGLLVVRRAMDATFESAGKASEATGGEPVTEMRDTEEDDAEPS